MGFSKIFRKKRKTNILSLRVLDHSYLKYTLKAHTRDKWLLAMRKCLPCIKFFSMDNQGPTRYYSEIIIKNLWNQLITKTKSMNFKTFALDIYVHNPTFCIEFIDIVISDWQLLPKKPESTKKSSIKKNETPKMRHNFLRQLF